MTRDMTRAVFDCNVLLQACAKPKGPSGQAFAAVVKGSVKLFVSPHVLDEFEDVAGRPEVATKLRITPQAVRTFADVIRVVATIVTEVNAVFTLPRDKDDSIYINLAIAMDTRLVVSWDNDLLDLMRTENPDGQRLRRIAPDLLVVTPPQFIKVLG